MSERAVVFGASGHGKVVADAWLAAGVTVAGFLDDDAAKVGTTLLGLPVLGGSAWLRDAVAAGRVVVALGIGDNWVRQRVASRCTESGAALATVVHPRAVVAPSARLAHGVVVFAGAVINPDAVIEEGAIINTSATVEHDCIVGAFAHVSPNSTLGGGASVGRLAQLGIGATLLPRVHVGDEALIGGGSVVARDIDPRSVARGVPARVTREQEPR